MTTFSERSIASPQQRKLRNKARLSATVRYALLTPSVSVLLSHEH